MTYQMKALGCDPARLKGLSEKLIVSHYENNYGGAVKRLNAICDHLAGLDPAAAPVFVINGLKREQLIAMNSMILRAVASAFSMCGRCPHRGMTSISAPGMRSPHSAAYRLGSSLSSSPHSTRVGTCTRCSQRSKAGSNQRGSQPSFAAMNLFLSASSASSSLGTRANSSSASD